MFIYGQNCCVAAVAMLNEDIGPISMLDRGDWCCGVAIMERAEVPICIYMYIYINVDRRQSNWNPIPNTSFIVGQHVRYERGCVHANSMWKCAQHKRNRECNVQHFPG